MTVFLPLDTTISFPSSPAFLVASSDPASHVKRVVQAILKARRIVVVCGAGISVEAGIPDFRSSGGLFQSLKKDHPRLVSGKDLFDISIFKSEDTTSLFCQMIAQLSQLSEAAKPTKFHRLLRVLDDRRCLLRVYTQNIDALEEKSGLTFGIPGADSKAIIHSPRTMKAPGREASTTGASAHTAQLNEPSTSRTTSPSGKTTKCIPLHGTLQRMHCAVCAHSYSLRDYIEPLASGTLPPCPQCTSIEETRRLLGKRSHGVGRLRPSIVLYNEVHKDGEAVGSIVWKDLTGCFQGEERGGADLVLVVGTSLRVPGTKAVVRQFSKALRSWDALANATPDRPADQTTLSGQGLVTPTPSLHRSTERDPGPPVRTVYLNLEFPTPMRDWEDVFDIWIRGDVQAFAEMVHEELEKDEGVKVLRKERKRKWDETTTEAKRAKND